MAHHLSHGDPSSLEVSSHKWVNPQPLRQACDICRDRKVRCDRAEPKCGRCTRLGQSCGYDRRRRLPRDDLPGQVLLLQDRLAKAEALLTGSRNSVPPVAAESEITPAPMTLDQATSVTQFTLPMPPGLSQPLPPGNQAGDHRDDTQLQNSASILPVESTRNEDGLFSTPADGADYWPDLPVDWATFSIPTLEAQIPTVEMSTSLADASTSPFGQEGNDLSAEDLAMLHGN